MRYQKIKVIGFFLLSLYSIFTGAQELDFPALPAPYFDHLTPSDGLSSSSVKAIIQDKRGLIWMGTNDGLNRYDGTQFLVYRKTEGLPSDLVSSLFEDEKGNIWIGTEDGISLLPYLHQTLKSVPLSEPLEWHDEVGIILSIHKIDDCLYLASEKGLFSLCTEGETWSLTKRLNVATYDIEKPARGILWIATQQGVMELKGDRIEPVESLGPSSKELVLNGEAAWSASPNGNIYRLEIVSGQSTVFEGKWGEWSINQIEEMSLDPDGNLWVNPLGSGIYVLDGQTLSLRAHYTNQNSPLSSDLVEAFCLAKDGILWIGTGNSGCDLLIYNSHRNSFKLLQNQEGKYPNLGVDGIHGVFVEDDGTLWLGTDGAGIFLLQPDENYSQGYRIKDHLFIGKDSSNPIIYPYVPLHEKDQVYWIPDWRGLNRWDRKTNTWNQYYTLNSDEGRRRILDLAMDQTGTIWLGTFERGFASFNPSDWPNIEFKWYNDSEANGISENHVEAVLVDHSNQLWLGTSGGGLSMLDSSRQHYRHYRFDPDDTTSLSSDIVYSLFQSDSNTLWVGTHGGGLNKLDLQTGLFKRYTIKDGLPNNVVYSILEDNEGHLWMATNLGLSRLNPESDEIRNFNVSDGLQNNEFNRHAAFKGADGKLYFGGIAGLTYFKPEDIQINQNRPPVVISSIRVNKQEMDLTGDLRLTHDQNLIEFEFASLNYQQPEKNQYQYRLKGIEEEWVEAGNRTSVLYSNLSPGSYTFEVKGSNNDGYWSLNPTTFLFHIRHPWYQRWWAYVLYLLSSCLLLFLYVQVRRRKREADKEAERWKKQDEWRARLFTNITHEFRTPITLILGLSERLKQKVSPEWVENVERIHHSGEKLLDLVNQIMDLSQLEMGGLKMSYYHGDLIPFVKEIAEAFRQEAESRNLHIHFLPETESLLMDYEPERLHQVLNNLVSNALKFTPPGGHIYIRLDQKDTHWASIKVKDTGIGIAEEHLPKIFDRFYQVGHIHDQAFGEGSGIGLALVKELMKALDGDIQVRSKPTEGTEFTLTLPLKQQGTKLKNPPKRVLKPWKRKSVTTLPELPEVPVTPSAQLLLVEDNIDVLNFLSESLASTFQVHTATDGEKGLAMATKLIPDLIICDIMMPGRDGYSLCAELRKDIRTSHIPLIFLTAKADPDARLEGYRQGADQFLTKPFREEELHTVVNGLLENRQRWQDHYRFVTGLTEMNATVQDQLEENAFLKEVKAIIFDHLNDNRFTVAQLSRSIALSPSQLHRKLSALTGLSANQLIRMIRLKHAQKLLIEQPDLSISTVAYDCGFSSPNYFSRVFRKEFGMTPKEFIERHRVH